MRHSVHLRISHAVLLATLCAFLLAGSVPVHAQSSFGGATDDTSGQGPELSLDRIQAVFDFGIRAVRLGFEIGSILFEAVGKVLKLVLDFIPTLPSSPEEKIPTNLLQFTAPPVGGFPK